MHLMSLEITFILPFYFIMKKLKMNMIIKSHQIN